MALSSILRKGVAIADKLTRSVQITVQHYAWTGQDGFGAPIFAPMVERKAIRELRSMRPVVRQRNVTDGTAIAVQDVLTFLTQIDANGATGRREPIDPRDKLVLDDGTTGPIIFIDGPHDGSTGKPFILQLWLGVKGGQSK